MLAPGDRRAGAAALPGRLPAATPQRLGVDGRATGGAGRRAARSYALPLRAARARCRRAWPRLPAGLPGMPALALPAWGRRCRTTEERR